MSINDFIDRRRLDDRRRRRPGTNQRVSGELILIPDFDTFILHNPNDNPDRWNFLPNTEPDSVPPKTSFELPIGLMNPWNHADGIAYPQEGGPFGALIPTRTPTRTVMGSPVSR